MKRIGFSDEEIFFDYNDRLCNDGKWSPENHYHNFFEIYFLKSGTCDYFVEDKIYHMIPGDLAIIRENVIHNTVYGGEICSRMLINCSKKIIPECMVTSTLPKVMIFRNYEKSEEISHIFSEIKNQYKNLNEYSGEFVFCYIRLLMLIAGSSENMYNEEVRHKYTEGVTEYVKKNISDISLAKAAKEFSVSEEHLSRQFKRDTGLTFTEYVTLIRFKKAEKMLLGKKETITNIAHMCGFNDSNYFSARFKKIYGISPIKWRNMKNKLTQTEGKSLV